MPLTLARRAAEDIRLVNAATALEAQGEAVTSRALAETARISLNTACAWLRERRTGAREDASLLSVLHYNPYSTSDNMPAAENGTCIEVSVHTLAAIDLSTAAPAQPNDEPLLPVMPAICPAASHQLLWRWSAGTWHCPVCAT